MSADDKTESEVGTQEASTDGSTSQPKEPETLMEANPMGLATILNSGMVYYERLPMLEVVFDRLVRLMTTSMRNLTGDNVEINLESITSVRFGDYVHSIPQPSMINVFVAEEWDNHGIVMLDSELIYSMIDVLLGGRKGSSSVRPENRHYTTIEMNLIEKMVQVFLSDLSAAFDPICPITLIFERLETNSKFASIARPANAAVLVRLSVLVDNRGGCIELVLPYATLEPIRELLLQNFMGEKFGRDTIWENHLASQLYFTDFELSALLDQITVPLHEVLSWDVGSQILLNATPTAPVNLLCGEHPLFIGQVGRKMGNIAVKIDNFIIPEEGTLHVNSY
ncbi:flagellar motor switch protein FliM [Candidatus Paracaedibacter symbiosus]|uniref:flagellar motor switch protein FliM n=1 Tax=Candidatus Paracaedibacter symbiosus TaxID=244582 RepID=UPI00068FA822|nr:flagellar motor switch protein FliM [Candidatus Paracaedibacter symbiosus]